MRRIKVLKNLLLTVGAYALFGGAFFYCLTGTLDNMTQSDCARGVEAACEVLK
jgi:hypothetical protein